MRLILAGGTTATARIPGLSAAGADPEAMPVTPSADLELVEYGAPVRTGQIPVSPTGCPTPALITRAIRDLLEFPVTAIDAGLSVPTGAPTVDIGSAPGADIREETAVSTPEQQVNAAATVTASIPEQRVLVGETIPGGTTTALAVLQALGETPAVSSSLPENPLEQKQEVVTTALRASDITPGACAKAPLAAIEAVGDPVQAAILGMIRGAASSEMEITLAGGTQQLAIAALARHDGIEIPLTVATTPFVVDGQRETITQLADELGVTLRVTDPHFEEGSHVAFQRYRAGEAKEGVGMGGVLALAADADVGMEQVRSRVQKRYTTHIGPPPAQTQ